MLELTANSMVGKAMKEMTVALVQTIKGSNMAINPTIADLMQVIQNRQPSAQETPVRTRSEV